MLAMLCLLAARLLCSNNFNVASVAALLSSTASLPIVPVTSAIVF
jgi:hypothetical protein